LDLERETLNLALTRLVGALGEEDIVAGIRNLTAGFRTAVTARGEPERGNDTKRDPD